MSTHSPWRGEESRAAFAPAASGGRARAAAAGSAPARTSPRTIVSARGMRFSSPRGPFLTESRGRPWVVPGVPSIALCAPRVETPCQASITRVVAAWEDAVFRWSPDRRVSGPPPARLPGGGSTSWFGPRGAGGGRRSGRWRSPRGSDPIERGPAFDAARPKLARSALVPSRVFDEPDVWTTREADVRQLDLFGHRDGEKYRLDMRPSAPPPEEAGDYRGRLRLSRIDDRAASSGRCARSWRWGRCGRPTSPTPSPGSCAPRRGSPKRRPGPARPQTFPRAAAVFSRLFRLETLELTPDGGATAIRLGLRLDPDGMEETAPQYAAFLKKWAAPMRMSAAATDVSGAGWWSVEAADMLWTVRLRVRDGSLVPLEGTRRPARARTS